MNHKKLSAVLLSVLILIGATANAQQFEAVYSMEGVGSSDVAAAFDDLFTDPAMKGAKVSLYAADFGVREGSLKLVADFDNYDQRAERDSKRRASHGWARFQLEMKDLDFLSADMVGVVADHGKPRHTAGYLLVYVMKVQDPATYAAALAELNKGAGNPGVLRLVNFRTGSTAATHAVLIGGDDFAAVNKYMDKLFASDAFAAFAAKVRDIRSVVHIESYRKVGAWGY